MLSGLNIDSTGSTRKSEQKRQKQRVFAKKNTNPLKSMKNLREKSAILVNGTVNSNSQFRDMIAGCLKAGGPCVFYCLGPLSWLH
ncbi:hypothetical protein SLE2022_360290 [Rubroshorea leprosula]